MKNTIFTNFWENSFCYFLSKIEITSNLNNVTPPHPPALIIFKLRVFLIICCNSFFLTIFAQDSTSIKIPDLIELENSIKNYYLQKMEAELSEFNYKIKGKFLSYLPSVGFTLGLPSVSWSSQNLLKISNDKRQKKAKIESIILKNSFEYNKTLNDVKIEYEKIKLKIEKLEQKQVLKNLHEEIFKIKKEGFESLEISPEDFLNSKINFQKILNDFENEKTEIEISIFELKIKSNFQMSYDSLE